MYLRIVELNGSHTFFFNMVTLGATSSRLTLEELHSVVIVRKEEEKSVDFILPSSKKENVGLISSKFP